MEISNQLLVKFTFKLSLIADFDDLMPEVVGLRELWRIERIFVLALEQVSIDLTVLPPELFAEYLGRLNDVLLAGRNFKYSSYAVKTMFPCILASFQE